MPSTGQGFIATFGPTGQQRQPMLQAFGDGGHDADPDLDDVLAGGIHHLVRITPGSVTVRPVDPAACAGCGPEVGWGQYAIACNEHHRRGMDRLTETLAPAGGPL